MTFVRLTPYHPTQRAIRPRRLSSFSRPSSDPSGFTLFLLALIVFLLTTPALYAQWEPDVRLTFNDSTSYLSANNAHCLAAEPGGVLHAVWYDHRSGRDEIFYKRSSDQGTTWSPDIRLSGGAGNATDPAVATSGTAVHLTWQDDRDGNPEIYYKRSTDEGITWSSDTRLTRDPSLSWTPSLAAWDSLVYVAWTDDRDVNLEIYGKRSADGGITWAPDARLTQDPYGSLEPSVSGSGTLVHLAWMDNRDGNEEIYYKRSSDGGTTWGADTNLTFDGNASDNPCLSVSGPWVHLVWENEGGDVYYKNSDDGGLHWSTGRRLAASTGGFPSISSSGATAHATWVDARNGNQEIYYKTSLNWMLTTRLTDDPNHSNAPSGAVAGQAVYIVWADDRDGNYEIYFKLNPTGNSGMETAEDRGKRLEIRVRPQPNPFTTFAVVPGQEKETFELYDIAGRKVGTYRGDRIGANLPAGVYFLRTSGKPSTPVRIVKVR